ncbi:MAG: DUF4097 family beta strand repeat-containing protein [Anaerolineae bacterium]
MSDSFGELFDGVARRLITLFGPWSQQVEQMAWTLEDPINLLKAHNVNGSISVHAANQNWVTVDAWKTVRAPSEGGAAAFARRVRVRLTQRKHGIYLHAVYPHPPLGYSVFVRYEITVPRAIDMDLYTQNGGITVGGVEGALEAETRTGNIYLNDTLGPVTLYTAEGDIRVADVDGTVDAESSSGAVRLHNVSGVARLRTTSGPIVLNVGEGVVRARSFRGDVELQHFKGRAEGQTISGDIKVSFARLRESSEFITQDGSIDLVIQDVAEDATALEAEALEGDINLAIVPDASGLLDAGAGAGSVHCHLPVSGGQKSKHLLVGQLGEGKTPLIKLRTFEGDITIRPYEASDESLDS